MIKSTTLRLSNRSTQQLLSNCIGASNSKGGLLQRNSFHSIGRFPLSSPGGRISWIGTLGNDVSNRFVISDKSHESLDFLNGHSRLSFDRMFSTTSVSKKQDENESETTTKATDAVEGEKPQQASFQSMVRRYGKVFIGTWMAVYATTILGLFMSVQSGHIDAMYMISLMTGTSAPSEPGGVADPATIQEAASAMKDLVELLEKYTITRPFAPMVEEYPWTANFAIAWIATKFTEPIRFGATVVLTPPVARFLGYRTEKTKASKDEKR